MKKKIFFTGFKATEIFSLPCMVPRGLGRWEGNHYRVVVVMILWYRNITNIIKLSSIEELC